MDIEQQGGLHAMYNEPLRLQTTLKLNSINNRG